MSTDAWTEQVETTPYPSPMAISSPSLSMLECIILTDIAAVSVTIRDVLFLSLSASAAGISDSPPGLEIPFLLLPVRVALKLVRGLFPSPLYQIDAFWSVH